MFQTVELEIEKTEFTGLSFVLLADGKWIKNDGSDFHIDFISETIRIPKASLSLSLSLSLSHTHTHTHKCILYICQVAENSLSYLRSLRVEQVLQKLCWRK